MSIQEMVTKWTQFLHQPVYDEVKKLTASLDIIDDYVVSLTNQVNEQLDIIESITEENKALRIEEVSEVDEYCKNAFTVVDVPRYQQKRYVDDKLISVVLNQFITPNQFEVQRTRRNLYDDTLSPYNWYHKIGNYIAQRFTWTEESTDNYMYAEEILLTRKGDCEDHSFCMASIEPKLGVAYGFYDNGTRRFGHAWNVFVLDGELYHLETTSNRVEIFKDTQKHPYVPHYIITKDNAYQVRGGINFGKIARW